MCAPSGSVAKMAEWLKCLSGSMAKMAQWLKWLVLLRIFTMIKQNMSEVLYREGGAPRAPVCHLPSTRQLPSTGSLGGVQGLQPPCGPHLPPGDSLPLSCPKALEAALPLVPAEQAAQLWPRAAVASRGKMWGLTVFEGHPPRVRELQCL